MGTNGRILVPMATGKRRSQGHIEERPNGSFRVIVYAGQDPLTGKDRRLRKTCATYAEAQVELVRLSFVVSRSGRTASCSAAAERNPASACRRTARR